ncbi:MAG: BamA/TamA family outer membrane protein [Chitinophagaceae bacterium]|nr:BamA/TamA family outer membrane protein [Chitinophagaceae bacterium]
MTIRTLLYLICIVSFFAACNESKHLAEGQRLYVANKIKTQTTDVKKGNAKSMASELDGLLRPRLNSKILGLRVKLWIYNIAGTTKKEKGFKYWLKYKVGEPPVLATPTMLEKNRDVLQNHLENKGYFKDSVSLDTHVKNKKLTAVYTAQFGPQYTIRNFSFPHDSGDLGKRIDSVTRRSRLRKGAPYDLDVIKDERVRIDTRLKQRGFYFFNPNYLIVDVDTTVGNHQLDMFMRLKDETPEEAREIWHIDKIKVFAEYDLRSDTSHEGVVIPGGIRLVDTAHLFKPSLFPNTIIFRPGNIYRLNDHTQSLSRLVSLGVFRFVKAGYKRSDSTKNGLDVTYYLNPTQKKSIRFEVSGLTRSDNTTGGEVALSWRNRNLFKRAELFTSSIYAGLEEQLLGNGVKISTRRGGVDLNLYIPRIVSGPFHWSTSSQFVPKTRINLGYDLFDRSHQYTLTSARGSFGYIFKQSLATEHTVNLFSINYVRPTNIDPNYQAALDTNITLARAIERQFIIGTSYNFNYNSQARPNRKKNNFYFNGNVDGSGNLLGLITGANLDKGKEVHIFNTPFSQYIRFEGDIRHYLSWGRYSMLASRITGGIGIAYGNSLTMPFVKQFFAGGTNDIRAFRSRALGPGSFFRGNPNKNAFLPDQPGDIKLAMNLEYRTKLFSIVRWALFVDAGNIWTRTYDSSRVGSAFSSHFLNDVGVGIGTGLRFDLSILVLRIDVATPVRYPWLPDGHKWVFNKVTDISNMVLNLAIGYPF